MSNVFLECKENSAFDLLELKNGTMMYRGVFDETVDLIRREKAIQKLIKMREVKNKKFEEWQKAFANSEDSRIEECKREVATRCTYKYDGAYTMCKAFYGEETIINAFRVYFGELNR